MRRNAADWLKQPRYTGIIILDPDGWDRRNFARSWAESITEQEFNSRIRNSTITIQDDMIYTFNAE